MRRVLLNTCLIAAAYAQTTQPVTVQVTLLNNITSTGTVIDNRSVFTAQNTIHTFCAAGTGSWSATIQYSDTASSGPWNNFSDSSASISNASTLSTCGSSTGAIGGGTGYHAFLRFNISGTVSISYTGQKSLWMPFPLPVGSSTTFGSITSGVNTTAAMVVGSGATLSATGSGQVNANVINGVTLSGLSTGLVKLTSGVPSIAVAGTDYLYPPNNLSDVASASTSRTNLGLGSAATQASSFFLQTANNLSDLASATTARINLGITQANIAALWTGSGCSTTTNSLLINGSCGSGTGLPSGNQTQYLQLTPNSATVTYQWNSLNSVNPNDYNYSVTPSSPSTLTGAGGSQVVTLAVCPLGIYGSTWSPVYITAGSGGTAEAITPSGGTCSTATLGSGGGTIIVSPANNHGAGYAITSATAGFQEAAVARPSNTISFSGTANWYTGVSLPSAHPGIVGVGPIAVITLQYNSGNGISLTAGGTSTRFANFSISPLSGVMTSGALIYNTNIGASIYLEDLNIGLNGTRDAYIGVQAAFPVYAKNVYGYATYLGFSMSNEMHFDVVHISSSSTTSTYLSGSAAIYVTLQTGGVLHAFTHDAGVFSSCLIADSSSNAVNELAISDMYCDHFASYGIYTPSSTNAVQSWEITNSRIEDNSGLNNGTCIKTNPGVSNWNISNTQCGYWNAGIVLSGGSYINITGLTIFPKGNSSSGPYGQGPTAIGLDTAVSHVKIGHSLIGIGPENSGTISKYGIVDNAASGGSSYVDVFANNIQGSSGNVVFFNAGGGVGWNVWNNTGVDDVWGTVSSAATINLASANWYTRSYITGTTSVTTINFNSGVPQSGRSITLNKSDTGTLSIGGSSQIPETYSLTQHSQVTLIFDGVSDVWNGTTITGSGGGGTVTSVSGACGITGTVTTTGNLTGSEVENAQTGTSYTVGSSDCGKLVSLSNSGSVAVTLTAPATLGSGWYADIVNLGVGTATLTPASGTINGNSTQVLTTGQGGHLESNGTNFRMVLGTGSTSGGLGSASCSSISVITGTATLAYSGTVNCNAVTITAATTIVLPSISGTPSGSFHLQITNSTPTSSPITYSGASEVGLPQPDASSAGAITNIEMYFIAGFWYQAAPAVSSTATALTTGQIFASDGALGPPVPAVASNIIGLFSGGHSSSSYYLATDGSQQLAGSGCSGSNGQIAYISSGACAGVNASSASGANVSFGGSITGGSNGRALISQDGSANGEILLTDSALNQTGFGSSSNSGTGYNTVVGGFWVGGAGYTSTHVLIPTGEGIQFLPVTTLATCNSVSQFMIVSVTTANTQTWGATAALGGSLPALLMCDGTNWTVVGK